MFFGQGIDIVNIKRVREIYKNFGIKFLKKICSDIELKKVPSNQIIEYLSGRFTAKEAYFKATNKVYTNLEYKRLSIINNKFGKPEIVLDANEEKKISILKKKYSDLSINVSISNEKDFCVAVVTIIGI